MLGEISAFGGINVEPSVRSCFEKAGDTGFIEVIMMMTMIFMDRMMIRMATMKTTMMAISMPIIMIITMKKLTILSTISMTTMAAILLNDDKNIDNNNDKNYDNDNNSNSSNFETMMVTMITITNPT